MKCRSVPGSKSQAKLIATGKGIQSVLNYGVMSLRKTLTISQLAQSAGVNVETIRYYERIGLLRQPPRPPQGWRRYDRSLQQRLQFIRRAQGLGFSLDEIKDLLAMRGSTSQRTCDRVNRKATAKLAEIDVKIRDLQAMRKTLQSLARTCPEEGAKPCPFLDALDAADSPISIAKRDSTRQ